MFQESQDAVISGAATRPIPPEAVPSVGLTPREQQVLNLMAKGFSHLEIARLLQVSVNTTRTQAKSIYSKLNVHSRSQAVFEAAVLGLLEPLPWSG